VFNALNKWSTKKASITQGFYLGDVRLQRFLFLLFHSTFSRHGKAQASLALLIWLNENVPFHGTFSRHGKAQASLALLIWLNENVLKVAQGHLMFTSRFALVVILNINFH